MRCLKLAGMALTLLSLALSLNGCGKDKAADHKGAAAQEQALSAPKNLKAEPGSGEVTLSWDSVEGAEGYVVFWSKSAGVDQGSARSGQTGLAPTHRHTGLDTGATYYYRVAAVRANVLSALSTELGARPALPKTAANDTAP